MSELDLERRARRLVGQRIGKVLYQKTGWTDTSWEVPDRPGLHSVDLAVYLETASDALFKIGWADELGVHHGFGVSVRSIRVPDRDRGVLSDLSGDPAWRALLGKPIQAARIHWESVQEALRGSLSIGVAICADYLRRLDYPQSLELVFEEGSRVVFDAARLDPNGQPIPLSNNLLVRFGRSG